MTDTPAFACDCHLHVFGDPARYPPAAQRAYTPVAATLEQWRAMAHPLGLQRLVLVQPSAYGTDNTCMLDALRAAAGTARAVAVIDDATPDAELSAMAAVGVVGVRLNLITGVSVDPTAIPNLLRATAARIAPLGWHLQLLARGALIDTVAAIIPTLGVPVVFDHMASVSAALGPDQPGLNAVLRLLREGHCWMKVSGADHVASRRDAPEEALLIMRALIAANPDRIVWGTDWPHIGPLTNEGGSQKVTYLPLDHAGLLAVLHRAAGDAASRILADNPARLYGWK
jgi:predicted TIM-barrel fold metal-dependent hydrolase